MSANRTIIKGIAPIATVDQFADILSRLAPAESHVADPLGRFRPKIDIMERFALGSYQWCVVDFATQQLLAVGGMVEEMTGKPPAYWLGTTADKYILELAFPDDVPYWMGYVQFIYTHILRDPLQHKNRSLHPHIYTRMKNGAGIFRKVVTQFIDWIVDEDGGVRFCLCQTTDISHIKADGPPQMVILEVKNGQHRLMVSDAPSLDPRNAVLIPSFTQREKEVIRLLAAGFSSKMISVELGIARNTVENHRQRLLKKAGCHTSSELTAYAVNNGLL